MTTSPNNMTLIKTGANLVLSDLFAGASYPTAQQTAALTHLLEQGAPSLRTERWRYTTLRKAINNKLSLVKSATGELPKHPALSRLETTEKITVLNGELHGNFNANGVTLSSSKESIKLAAHKHTDEFIDDLNIAFSNNVLKLDITTDIEELLVIHFHHTVENSLHANRIEIDMAKSSSAKVLILNTSDDALGSTLVPVTSVNLEANSHAHVTNIQDLSLDTYQLAKTHAHLHADSVFKFTQLEIGGQLTRHDVVADVLGKGAEFIHDALIHGEQKQHQDIHMDVYHHIEHTQSTMNVKGVMDDKSRGVFNGKIYVEVDAQQVNADLQNNNLLLSKFAEINTKPELEIYADDVKCAHGATIGQLNEESLFYLRSRGLDQEAAEKVLVSAFSRSTYQGLVPSEIETYLDERLGFEA